MGISSPAKLLLGAALVLGCSAPRAEVVVTAAQFGDDWPLNVGSAVLLCGASGEPSLLKVGSHRYALDQAGRAAGHLDAAAVARELPIDPQRSELGTRPADPASLLSVCNAQLASNSNR